MDPKCIHNYGVQRVQNHIFTNMISRWRWENEIRQRAKLVNASVKVRDVDFLATLTTEVKGRTTI